MLLHACCGPCSAYPVKYLLEHNYNITGFFFNPNIHPYKEFRRRLETAVEFFKKMDVPLIVDDTYELESFLQQALTAGQGRCRACYELRLRKTARYAKKSGFDCFSTTLMVSPYQQHIVIKELAENIAAEEEIDFYYTDFRTGWNEGVAISKEMELYRQPYCGCIFSEKERYYKPKKERN